VIIKDDCLPTTRWKLGLVIEIHPRFDGLTRVVTLRSAPGVQMRRSTVKLCGLLAREEHDLIVNK